MNLGFLDSIDPAVWVFLIGLGVGVFLEVVAVLLTSLMFRPKNVIQSERPSQQAKQLVKVERKLEQAPKRETRMEQVGLAQPTRVPDTRSSMVSVNRKPLPSLPPEPTPEPTLDVTPVVLPQATETMTERPQRVAKQRFWYYVEGYAEPFPTILQALNAIGVQVRDVNHIAYDRLSDDTRAKIRREVAER